MYTPNDFIIRKEDEKSSRKLYKTFCDQCKKDRGYKRISKAKRPYCRTCFNIITHTDKVVSEETKQKMKDNNHLNNGGVHPLLGKHHSEETKAILSQKQIDHCAQNGNQFVTGKSKGEHTEETINQISANNLGKEPKWKGRTFLYSGPKGCFKMRSSYELFYANWMDRQGIEWKYEPHFKLSTGKSYAPDFQLATGVIIEIKGYWTEKGLSKWKQFCLDYPEITKLTLMKDDLVELGL